MKTNVICATCRYRRKSPDYRPGVIYCRLLGNFQQDKIAHVCDQHRVLG